MTELKTIKDIIRKDTMSFQDSRATIYNQGILDFERKLRLEAINWAKNRFSNALKEISDLTEFKWRIKDTKFIFSKVSGISPNAWARLGEVGFIVDFFNLGEEDLK